MSRNSLCGIRERIALHKGSRVRYRASRGRRKVEERQGVILETYPHLFTMYIESQQSTVSFRYAELLTREVEVELLPGREKLV